MDGLVRKDLDSYVSRANDVIFFKLVRRESDIEEDKGTFHPEFTHQIFGESENIFGFKDLKILMCYSSGLLTRFISVSYSEKIPASLSKGVEADDIIASIREHVPGPFTTNIDHFAKRLVEDEKFRPLGDKLNQMIHTKRQENEPHDERVFEVYRCDMSVTGFRELHDQMQTWLLWMIDGASYIDADDERWEFLTMYEKSGNIATNGCSERNGSAARYHFVGYCTIYRYYAYPDKIRPRISQFLILPPFQRKGLGAHMLQSVYDFYRTQSTVVDIAVEDPAENFTRLRDFVDARNCLSLAEFSEECIRKGWCNGMALSAQKQLKLNRNQARRVYEILKLKSVDRSDEAAYRSYRLEVKNRLNAPFLKSKLTDAAMTDEVRVATLQNMYDQAEEEYLQTIESLAAV